MRNPLQEKIQITVPTKDAEPAEGWASFESSRDSQADVPSFKGRTNQDLDGNKFNMMPPGMEIDNQCSTEINPQPFVMSGQLDVSKDVNPQAFAEGFTKREQKGTDDQYTGEHVDQFYGDAGGFVERNNYLDRI